MIKILFVFNNNWEHVNKKLCRTEEELEWWYNAMADNVTIIDIEEGADGNGRGIYYYV